MAPSPTRPRRPVPPGLRMTPGNKADDKEELQLAGSGDESSSSSTTGVSQENRRTSLRFAPGTNPPPPRRVPLRRRAAGIYRPNDEGDLSEASELGEDGREKSTSGPGQENDRPTAIPGVWLSPPLRRVYPMNNMTWAREEVDDESRANGACDQAVSSSTPPADQENDDPSILSTPRAGRSVLVNEDSNSDRNRSPSPKKRKHIRREMTLDSEYRRDLLTFEGIDVRDFQGEADAQADAQAEAEDESPKKKGKTAASYETPDPPWVLGNAARPIGDHIPVRNLRAQVIAQTGFASHFERSVSDVLDEEDLFTPEVDHIEQDSQHPVIIPMRDGSRAQYPAGSAADRVGAQLGERRRQQMIAARARFIRDRNEEGRIRREYLAAKAAAASHDAAVAHAAEVANSSDEEPVATDVDEVEDEEDLEELALHRCSTF